MHLFGARAASVALACTIIASPGESDALCFRTHACTSLCAVLAADTVYTSVMPTHSSQCVAVRRMLAVLQALHAAPLLGLATGWRSALPHPHPASLNPVTNTPGLSGKR